MKTKTKDTIGSFDEKSLLKIKTCLQKPTSSKTCSANWKSLLNELTIDKKEKSNKNGITKTRKNFKKHKNKPKNKGDKIWFDCVTEEEIALNNNNSNTKVFDLKNVDSDNVNATKVLALDCEMVGTGFQGQHSVLARVSIINSYGNSIYDKYVKSSEKITDFRTEVSGIRPYHMNNAEVFSTVQKEVADIIKGHVIVGHALWNDFKVLFLSHEKHLIRDTAKYIPFQKLCKKRNPSLKMLSKTILGVDIQQSEHNSVEDCRAVMKLYLLHKKQWEESFHCTKKIKKYKKTTEKLTK